MARKFPLAPKNPQRICWGCDRYCAADSLACGNGSERTQHPVELFGEDWMAWGLDAAGSREGAADGGAPAAPDLRPSSG